MLYIDTGNIKASPVQATAPIKLMNSVNLGIIIALIAVATTQRVLKLILLASTKFLSDGNRKYPFDFSYTSNTGNSYIG